MAIKVGVRVGGGEVAAGLDVGGGTGVGVGADCCGRLGRCCSRGYELGLALTGTAKTPTVSKARATRLALDRICVKLESRIRDSL